MASVWGPKQLPSGSWRIRWRALDGSMPSRTYERFGDAAREARELARQLGPTIRGAARALGPKPPADLTIEQVVERWRQTRAGSAIAERPGADDYAAEAVREAKRMATELGWLHPRDARAKDVAELKRRRKNVGVVRPLSYLRLILRWARENAEQPFDQAADVAMRSPQSAKSSRELLTDRQAKAILARARRLQQLPIISCLAVYGWRPITACRLRVKHVDLARGTIRLRIKQNGEPWEHPLFPFHVAQLRTLIDKRGPDAPLFLNCNGRVGWHHDKLGGFYRDHLRHGCASAGNVYALKRLAISRMAIGAWPWPEPLAPADIQLFTGHKTKEQVLRYMVTNQERARSLVGATKRGALRGADGTQDVLLRPPVSEAAPAKVLLFPGLSEGRR